MRGENKLIEDLLNNESPPLPSSSIKHVIDKVLLRSSSSSTPQQPLSPNLKSNKKQPTSTHPSNSEDLFEQPDQLETNVSSTISFLIESKKKLFNQVQIELEKSSSKKQGIINLQNEIKQLDNEKEELIKSVVGENENCVINRINKTVTSDQELRSRLSSIDTTIEILEYFDRYKKHVDQYQQFTESNRIIDACFKFNEMFEWFTKNQPFELTLLYPQPRIIPSIKDQLKKRKNHLKSTLLESFTHSIVITSTEIQLSLGNLEFNQFHPSTSTSSSSPPSSLYTLKLIESLESLGLFDYIITLFSSNLISTFLKPIIIQLSNKITTSTTTSSTPSSSNITIKKYDSNNQEDQEDEEDTNNNKDDQILFTISNEIYNQCSIVTFYKFLIELFQFLIDNLFGSDNYKMINKFGNEVWPELSNLLMDEILKSKIPDDSRQLSIFLNTIKPSTIEFENQLIKIGLISSSNTSSQSTSLTKFVTDIEFHYSEKKKTKLLLKTREIILNDRYDSIKSDQSIFGQFSNQQQDENNIIQGYHFENRSILESTNTILNLCLNSLKEASTSSSTFKTQIYQGCRDIFEIYYAIYLKHHISKLEKVPLLACLFYNSCLFLSHCFLILPIEYQQTQQSPQAQSIYTFIDYSKKFNDLGNSFYSGYITQQLRLILSFLVDDEYSNQFENCKDQSTFFKIQNNFTNMNNELNRLSCIWKDVFPRSVYLELISKFAESILSTIIKMILKLQNIEMVETQKIADLQSSIYPVFIKFYTFHGEEEEEQYKPRTKLIKSWKKFWQIKMVLELPLSEIVTLYNKGHLSKLSNYELRLLILSIFDDFELKTNFLSQLNK